MSSLIERLEAADGGSRLFDAEIEVAIRAIEARRVGLTEDQRAKWRFNRMGSVADGHTHYQSEPVTDSLDAALALAERVLPGSEWRGGSGDGQRTRPWTRIGVWPWADATGSNLAIATCLAILAATQNSNTGGGDE